MTRTEALATATEFVEKLLPTRNDRGYPQGDLTQRVNLILEVADWLVQDRSTPSYGPGHAQLVAGGH